MATSSEKSCPCCPDVHLGCTCGDLTLSLNRLLSGQWCRPQRTSQAVFLQVFAGSDTVSSEQTASWNLVECNCRVNPCDVCASSSSSTPHLLKQHMKQGFLNKCVLSRTVPEEEHGLLIREAQD